MLNNKPISEVVVIFVTNKSLDNREVIPITEIFRYDIYDDGKDIINYIENRKCSGVDVGGRLSHDNKYVWDRFKTNEIKVGDEVQVQKSDHPLDGWTGKIKQIHDDDRVCLVLIDGYVFNIKKAYLEKYEP